MIKTEINPIAAENQKSDEFFFTERREVRQIEAKSISGQIIWTGVVEILWLQRRRLSDPTVILEVIRISECEKRFFLIKK